MFRQTTPPSASFNFIPGSVESNASSDATFYSHSQGASPASHTTTPPPRSPIRQHGPLLLPKVRTQDQIAEPTGGPVRHRRTTSTSSVNYAAPYNRYSRPSSMIRRGSSPYNHSSLASPVSQPSYDLSFNSTLNSPVSFASETRRASVAHARSHSATGVRGHSRAGSAGSIDENVISRFGFPTYRNLPSYLTASGAPHSNSNLITAPMAYSQVEDVSYTSTVAHDFSIPDFEPAPAVQAVQYPLASAPEMPAFDSFQSTTTTSLLEYLTAPNPSPALVHRINSLGRGIHTHFWWDIRNLRSWTDFTISSISSIPGLPSLLQIPVEDYRLPTPSRPNLLPENESALHDICIQHYGAKVNAALAVAQGDSHMHMRAHKSAPGPRAQPDFISNYQSDFEKTIFGDGRGRVVGLVKVYEQWNTGMRGESAPKQVLYLQGLAHLQHVMREHGCRYGFIMTEIELLCVRAGGPASSATRDPTIVNAETGRPIFGYLEVSQPIRLSTDGMNPETGDMQMTAGLALWYLHMLAKESPFAGMGSWRMDVGGPAALSRQNVIEKDDWIPKPNLSEKREAKRNRGWILPEDPLSKKECGRKGRARSAGRG